MVPAKVPLVLMAAIAMSAMGAAQTQSGKVFARYNKPLKAVSLDLATGTITRSPVVADRSATTTSDFSNNDLSGFVGVDTGNGFCEWFDAGVKGFAGNNSDLMNNFVFAYCSAMLAPGSGGPGGTVNLGFYEGYTIGGTSPTTAVAVFTLSGLPGNSASSSFLGGFSCFFINVTFGSLVAFADGNIGYSWGFLDTGTDGVLAGTWPFLSCVASCSGSIGQVDGQGMTDAIDEYCPPGFLRATFTFGTTSGSFTSMSMDVREATDFLGSEVLFNATVCPNPDTLFGVFPSGPPWATINRGYTYGLQPNPPRNGSFSVSIRTSRIPLPNGVQGPAPLPTGCGGRILVSGPFLSSVLGSFGPTGGQTPSLAIPASMALICLPWAAQATVVGGGVRVSSAIQGTIGTM